MYLNVKKLSFTAILLFIGLSLSGQDPDDTTGPWDDEKFFNIGYSLGLNAMTFRLDPSDEFTAIDSLYPARGNLYPGINIHLIIDFRLNQFFDIRLLPGLSFGQRNIEYDSGRLIDTVFSPQKLESSFIEVPLLLKYGWRMQNIKPYVIGGLNYRYDFYAQDKYRLIRPVYLRLNHPDLYYELGAGIDFYLTNIKFSMELKMSNGMNDILAHDPHPDYPQYCNAIETLKSRIWVLSFHFE
jgi:hypothetical protein